MSSIIFQYGETMKLEELLNIISKALNKPVSQSELANSLGVTRQTVSNRIKNESEVTVTELQRVENFFNISLFNSASIDNEIVYIDYYNDVFASCGQGNIVFSSEKTKLPVAISLIEGYSKSKSYSVINASGNSMTPTIDNGDKLIVEHWSGDQIQDNKIYVFCYNNEFFVKRLYKNLDEIIIKSDNPEYRTRSIGGKAISDLVLIGKIVAAIKQVG